MLYSVDMVLFFFFFIMFCEVDKYIHCLNQSLCVALCVIWCNSLQKHNRDTANANVAIVGKFFAACTTSEIPRYSGSEKKDVMYRK